MFNIPPMFGNGDPNKQAGPDEIKRRRALADALLAQGAKTQNVDSPFEAFGSLAQSFGGYFGNMRANRDEAAGLQSRSHELTNTFGAGGRAPLPTPRPMPIPTTPNQQPNMGSGVLSGIGRLLGRGI